MFFNYKCEVFLLPVLLVLGILCKVLSVLRKSALIKSTHFPKA